MNILLIGGTGFIGNALSIKLSKRKTNNLTIIHSSSINKKQRILSAKYLKVDLMHQVISTHFIINNANTVIIMTQPQPDIFLNILKSLKQLKSIKRIIYLSSLLIYQESRLPQTENNNPQPLTQYEKMKFYEEQKLQKYCQNNNYKLCIIRLANVYGDIKNKGIIGHLLESIFLNKEIIINGNGEQKRDYIHIKDLIKQINEIINLKQIKILEIFNLCTGISISINSLIKIINKISRKNISIKHGSNISEKQFIFGNNQKFMKTFPTKKNQYSISQGLKITYQKYLRYYSNNI